MGGERRSGKGAKEWEGSERMRERGDEGKGEGDGGVIILVFHRLTGRRDGINIFTVTRFITMIMYLIAFIATTVRHYSSKRLLQYQLTMEGKKSIMKCTFYK